MTNTILAALPSIVAALPAAPPPNAAPGQAPSAKDMQAYNLLSNFDWRWLIGFAAVAFLIIGIIFFGASLFRKESAPKLNFFLYVIFVGAVRIIRPNDKAWIAAAVVGLIIAAALLITTLAAKKDWNHTNRKEPVYYLLNAFALGMFLTPRNEFEYSIAIFAVFASLFFINSKKAHRKDKYKKRDADPAILESLEKRAKKKFGRD